MIKAVLIDIDNTLLDFSKSAKKAIEIMFQNEGLVFNEHVFDTFNTINDALWIKIEKKEITKPQLYAMRWKTIFDELGIDRDPQKAEASFRSILSGIAEPVDNAYSLLDYLHTKYKLYAATNSSFDHQIKRLTTSNMIGYFEELFVSERVGVPKPAKEFFDYCLNSIGNITPNETVLIGDSLTADIQGGFEYGLRTIWFNPNGQEIPDHPKPDHTVSSLLEIKNIL